MTNVYVLDQDDKGTVAVPLRYVRGARAAVVQLLTLLGSLYESWPENQDLGIPWDDTLAPDVVLEGRVRQQIQRIPEITAVVVSVRRAGERVSIEIQGRVGQETVEISVSPEEVVSSSGGPSLCYTVVIHGEGLVP